jgi:hypothetical protein
MLRARCGEASVVPHVMNQMTTRSTQDQLCHLHNVGMRRRLQIALVGGVHESLWRYQCSSASLIAIIEAANAGQQFARYIDKQQTMRLVGLRRERLI